MSLNSIDSALDPGQIAPQVFEDKKAQLCLMPMGMTSENVAEKFGISRQKQDLMAFESH